MFQQFEFPKLIMVILNISEVRKEMRVVDICLENFFILLFWADCMRNLGNKCRTACMFLCALNKQLFSIIRIVALQSVNKSFREELPFHSYCIRK
jgi:hypothetical protein